MKIRQAGDADSIRALLDHLNACHDGVIRRVSFIKNRSYDVEGSVLWPSVVTQGKEIGTLVCDVEMEILLNSYVSASPRQIIWLDFEGVRGFRFCQDTLDYSEILDVVFRVIDEHTFEFVFRAGPEKRPIDALTLVCQSMLCVELESVGGAKTDDKNGKRL